VFSGNDEEEEEEEEEACGFPPPCGHIAVTISNERLLFP